MKELKNEKIKAKTLERVFQINEFLVIWNKLHQ